MKKIGIITMFHNNYNYGGILQAYALTRAVNELGNEAQQIKCCVTLKNNFKKVSSMKLNVIAKKVFHKIIYYTQFDLNNKINKRKLAIDLFKDKYIKQSKKVYDISDISETINDYETFITGSDQVWNPYWYNDIYLLSFVPNTLNKISYAASISRETLNDNERKVFSENLKSYKAISTREPFSAELLKTFIDNPNITSTIDPTLLFNSQEWNEICSDRLIESEYLFYYFLNDSLERQKQVKLFAKKNNLKIVVIPYLSFKKDLDKNFANERMYEASPADFISLIKYAKFVFTDSFHATVFSNIYDTKFVCFGKETDSDMDVRLKNLLNIFDNDNHFCNEKLTSKYYECEYNKYSKSDEILKLQEYAKKYLKENL